MNQVIGINGRLNYIKQRGSHGCVNLQLEDVKNIYNLVSMRDMVFIHD